MRSNHHLHVGRRCRCQTSDQASGRWRAETLCCPFFSVWASMIPCPLSAAGCDVRTLSSLTLMTCISCLQREHVRRTTFSKNSCWWAQGSSSTQGRPERGIAEGHNLQIWKSWGRKCGVQAASRFWALLWGRLSLSAVWSSEAVTWVPDLQCGWQILLQCAGPRCHHILRTLPPSESAEYGQRHDDGMWQAMQALMGGLMGTEEQKLTARQLTTLPMRVGGLGLRCARRMAPAAHWSSWADALPMVAQNVVDGLEGAPDVGGCIGELRAISLGLDRQGFVGRPTWTLLKLGARPPPVDFSEPGEWAHGWQYFASSVSEFHHRKTTVLRQSCPSHQAHLRSHSGGGCSDVLHGCPTSAEFVVEPELFRTLVLERSRLPLAVADVVCECGAPLDSRGRHRAACPQSGRLRTRAVAPERTLARVCREAGATVRQNVKLRDMNVAVRATMNDASRCSPQDSPFSKALN